MLEILLQMYRWACKERTSSPYKGAEKDRLIKVHKVFSHARRTSTPNTQHHASTWRQQGTLDLATKSVIPEEQRGKSEQNTGSKIKEVFNHHHQTSTSSKHITRFGVGMFILHDLRRTSTTYLIWNASSCINNGNHQIRANCATCTCT